MPQKSMGPRDHHFRQRETRDLVFDDGGSQAEMSRWNSVGGPQALYGGEALSEMLS